MPLYNNFECLSCHFKVLQLGLPREKENLDGQIEIRCPMCHSTEVAYDEPVVKHVEPKKPKGINFNFNITIDDPGIAKAVNECAVALKDFVNSPDARRMMGDYIRSEQAGKIQEQLLTLMNIRPPSRPEPAPEYKEPEWATRPEDLPTGVCVNCGKAVPPGEQHDCPPKKK